MSAATEAGHSKAKTKAAGTPAQRWNAEPLAPPPGTNECPRASESIRPASDAIISSPEDFVPLTN